MKCYHAARWDGVRSVSLACEHCGVTVTASQCENRRFCSHDCYVASGVGAPKGEASSGWKGGTSKYYKRGFGWKDIADSVRLRDGFCCQGCGKPESQLTGKRRKLDVHHVIPYAVSNCNEPANLVSLCRSCHSKAEPSPSEVARLHSCVKHRKAFLERAQKKWVSLQKSQPVHGLSES
ncbi:HNH endonuclease [Loktanella sp. R86503]|uniref:HNH endonuclease n=1 Tax=Loktanella sp. R86503 TaxID=3093847 RepID=UPI0036DEE4BC